MLLDLCKTWQYQRITAYNKAWEAYTYKVINYLVIYRERHTVPVPQSNRFDRWEPFNWVEHRDILGAMVTQTTMRTASRSPESSIWKKTTL